MATAGGSIRRDEERQGANVSASRGEVMESTYSSGKRLGREQSRPKLRASRKRNNRDSRRHPGGGFVAIRSRERMLYAD